MNDLATSPERRDRAAERLTFFQRFLRRPQQVGSVIPSSRFLEQRLVRISAAREAHTVVELGPGTGGTTRALLRALSPASRLLAIEIDSHFAGHLRRDLRDPRFIVHEGSAERIADILTEHGLPPPDVVISGIPFSTMPVRTGENIVRAVRAVLAPDGHFVAYQFRDRVAVIGSRIFGRPEVAVELLNVPPMRVYRWRRN
ncbi:MAG: methyltransferase domain-containing protein [Gammaproteobacteria bacterium]|nr:methyltransferase domain-containing protein [Gammaproteobacteria bacterium]